MQEFCLEAVIDEVVNGVLENRPKNPYIEMSKMMEAKAIAEIVYVGLSSVLTDSGSAVMASISTNIGIFTASCGMICDLPGTEGDIIDFTMIQDHVSSFLLGKNPTDIQKVDTIIQRIADLDQSVAVALSMACARAGARHKGMELYQFLAECSRVIPAIPMPCISVISRVAGPDTAWNTLSQDVSVIPTNSSSLLNALEALTKAYRKVTNLVVERKLPVVPSSRTGCVKVRASLSDILKVASDAVSAEGAIGSLKLLVDMRGCDLAVVPTPRDSAIGEDLIASSAAVVRYLVGGEPPNVAEKVTDKKDKRGKASTTAVEASPNSPRVETYTQNGAEFVDNFVNNWIDFEMISIEDPANRDDLGTLRLLKTVRFCYSSMFHFFNYI